MASDDAGSQPSVSPSAVNENTAHKAESETRCKFINCIFLDEHVLYVNSADYSFCLCDTKTANSFL